jgi:hypothetical protein
MTHYQTGYIYKLVSKDYDLTYIGSTMGIWQNQLKSHKSRYNAWLNNKKSSTTACKLFELGDVDIFLIEKVKCENVIDLHDRQRYWIAKTKCVNTATPIFCSSKMKKNKK